MEIFVVIYKIIIKKRTLLPSIKEFPSVFFLTELSHFPNMYGGS